MGHLVYSEAQRSGGRGFEPTLRQYSRYGVFSSKAGIYVLPWFSPRDFSDRKCLLFQIVLTGPSGRIAIANEVTLYKYIQLLLLLVGKPYHFDNQHRAHI